MCGYSWYETANGVRHGYWDFRHSSLLRTFLPWLLLIDAALAGFGKIYLPLLTGKTVVCERFVLDILVDLIVAFDEHDLPNTHPGSLYLNLIPKSSKVIVLDLDLEKICERRPDLLTDHHLSTRLVAFRRLASQYDYLTLSSESSISDVYRSIKMHME